MKGLMPGRVEMMGLLGGQRRMKSMLVWIVVVSLAFTAGMYAAGGSWVRRGLGAHSSTLWKTGRPRHIPNWRESAEAEFGQDVCKLRDVFLMKLSFVRYVRCCVCYGHRQW